MSLAQESNDHLNAESDGQIFFGRDQLIEPQLFHRVVLAIARPQLGAV